MWLQGQGYSCFYCRLIIEKAYLFSYHPASSAFSFLYECEIPVILCFACAVIYERVTRGAGLWGVRCTQYNFFTMWSLYFRMLYITFVGDLVTCIYWTVSHALPLAGIHLFQFMLHIAHWRADIFFYIRVYTYEYSYIGSLVLVWNCAAHKLNYQHKLCSIFCFLKSCVQWINSRKFIAFMNDDYGKM